MPDHTPMDPADLRPDDEVYVPPKAEEISSEDRATTAAWLQTGEQPDAK